jgi:hypothetical protein
MYEGNLKNVGTLSLSFKLLSICKKKKNAKSIIILGYFFVFSVLRPRAGTCKFWTTKDAKQAKENFYK